MTLKMFVCIFTSLCPIFYFPDLCAFVVDQVVMIVLSWHMKAQEMGYYQKEEFINGLKELNCDSVDKIKGKLPALREELKDNNKLREIMKFAWHFAKDDAEKKTISTPPTTSELRLSGFLTSSTCTALEMAEGLLQLLLNGANHVDHFCSFLKEQTDYKGINLDQWMSFFEFCKTMKADMSDYDDQGACTDFTSEYSCLSHK